MIFKLYKYLDRYHIANAQNTITGKRYTGYGRSNIEALNNLFIELQIINN